MDNESYLENLSLAQQVQIDEAIAQREEARTWARMLRNRALIAEQNSDSACAAYRKMFEMWAKAEREKLLLLEALKGIADSIGGYCDVKECPQCDAYRAAKTILAKLE